MSTDNVTPFPPAPKPKKRKLPGRPAGVALQFADGGADGPSTLHVYQGLRGVCSALDSDSNDIDLLGDLSAAAAVLIGILEERFL